VNGEHDYTQNEPATIEISAINFLFTENGSNFEGLIDDVRIYNRALTQAEILVSMEGSEGYPYALGPKPADGAMLSDTWANLSWSPGDFAVSHDVYIGDNFEDVNNGAEGTFLGNQAATELTVGFPGFPVPDGLVPGTTYYWRIDEVNDTEPNSPWKGPIWSFSIPPKTAYFPDPADQVEGVSVDPRLSWTGGFGSKLHTVYFGDTFEEVDNATGGQTQGTTTYTPGTLKMASTYYWRVDEFDIVETHKGNVWSFTTEGAVSNPNPAKGAVDVTQTPILTWAPGFGSTHEIYFSTDADALENKASGNLGSETYEPGQLEWNTTYYWRIDEANSTNADSPWTGPLWSFTTANFLFVDDFESYNDIDPPDPESNRIFEAWPDGYDIPTNGALVGNDAPPYAEQSIVHSGIQSMPYFYDNSVGNSEATHTLTYPRDWTEKGVVTLSIWFRGNSDNAAEMLYVVLNGSAVVNHDNPNAAQIDKWTEWVIPLQAFADQGVNLANVNTIVIGFGNRNNPVAGGSGKMYFDDIRLYRPEPVDPGTDGLAAYYAFENDANDSSGNGNNGTTGGTTNWAAGMTGGALELDGTSGYVEIPFSESMRVLNQGDFTLTAWFRPDEIPPENKEVFQQGDENGTGRTWIFVHSSNEIRSYLGGGTTASGVGVEAGVWSHAAVVVTEGGDADTVQLYVNGEPGGEPSTERGMEDCEGVYFIGRHKNPTNFWDGLIDEVRLYNRALSDLEILYLASK